MKSLSKFRFINKIEGYSFLVLLFVAMPLKYYYGYPMATKIAGMIHGGLFIWFVVSLVIIYQDKLIDFKDGVKFFILSLLPFGSFVTEGILKKRDTI